MRTLSTVELFLDGILLGRIRRETGNPVEVDVPKNLADQQKSLLFAKQIKNKWNWRSPRKYMTIQRIMDTSLCISVEVIKWVYTNGSKSLLEGQDKEHTMYENRHDILRNTLIDHYSSSNPTSLPTDSLTVSCESDSLHPVSNSDIKDADSIIESNTEREFSDHSKIFTTSLKLRLFTAEVNSQIDEKLKQDLERAMKKSPPTNVKVSLLYVSRNPILFFSFYQL
jgi:hypothetical protein